jgi:hypothetical protein
MGGVSSNMTLQNVSTPGTLNSYTVNTDPVWYFYSGSIPEVSNLTNLQISSNGKPITLPYSGAGSLSDANLQLAELACLNNPNCVGMTFGPNVNIVSGQVTGSTTKTSIPEIAFSLKTDRQQLCFTADASLQQPYATFCSNLCSQKQNAGQCDNFMIPYCATVTGLSDPNCNCINSPVNYYTKGKDVVNSMYPVNGGSQYNPVCFDQSCISQGYITLAMLGGILEGCPDVSCFDISVLLNGTQDSNGNNLPQSEVNVPSSLVLSSCSSTNTVGIPTNLLTTPVVKPTTVITSAPTSVFTTTNIIIIGLLTLIIIGGIFYFVM